MEKVLQNFQRRLEKASNLHQMLKERPFVICLEVMQEMYILHLQMGRFSIEKHQQFEDKIDVLIQGDELAITKLVNGVDRLQRLEKHGSLTIKGSFPAILKAETIFYLNNVTVSS